QLAKIGSLNSEFSVSFLGPFSPKHFPTQKQPQGIGRSADNPGMEDPAMDHRYAWTVIVLLSSLLALHCKAPSEQVGGYGSQFAAAGTTIEHLPPDVGKLFNTGGTALLEV